MNFWVHRAHYSRSTPASKLVGVGFRESGRSIGVVIFGRGASSQIHSPFAVEQDAVCELCRVALGPHLTPTSRVVAIAVKLLRRQSPGLRLIVSYADPEQRGPSGAPHLGVLYQSMNWLYLGQTHRESLIQLNGRLFHPRSVTSRFGTRRIDWLRANVAADAGHVRTMPKHRYVLPLDDDMRRQLEARRLPYPKAVSFQRDRGAESGARGPQAGEVTPSTPAADTTREGAGAIPDPVAPVVYEAPPHV